jgi:hypothetical protein
MDSYQAIYDAVRSRLGNTDVGSAVSDAINQHAQGLSWAIDAIKHEWCLAAAHQQRPSILLRPSISIDGNMWCVLYGENLQDGVAGFGESPALAMEDFDNQWYRKLSPKEQPK